MAAGLEEHELAPEHGTDRGRIMPLNRKAAAALRPFGGKGADDDIAFRPDCLRRSSSISLAVSSIGEEVKGRPAVPEIIGCGGLPRRHTGHCPLPG